MIIPFSYLTNQGPFFHCSNVLQLFCIWTSACKACSWVDRTSGKGSQVQMSTSIEFGFLDLQPFLLDKSIFFSWQREAVNSHQSKHQRLPGLALAQYINICNNTVHLNSGHFLLGNSLIFRHPERDILLMEIIRLTSWGNGSLSHYYHLQGFGTIPGGCLGFRPSTVWKMILRL